MSWATLGLLDFRSPSPHFIGFLSVVIVGRSVGISSCRVRYGILDYGKRQSIETTVPEVCAVTIITNAADPAIIFPTDSHQCLETIIILHRRPQHGVKPGGCRAESLKTKVVLHNIDSGRCTTIASSSALATAADEEDLMVVVMEVGEEGNNNVEYEGADSGAVWCSICTML